MIEVNGKKFYSQEELDEAKRVIENEVRVEWLDIFNDMRLRMLPDEEFMFHGKKNTTVKFKNGNSITVRRMKGEEDSPEVALAFILAFQNYGKKRFRDLVKMFKEVK